MSSKLADAWRNYEGACVLDAVRRDNFRLAAQCVSSFGVSVGDMTAQFNYAHENAGYGAPASLTQYAMEAVSHSVYDWVVERKQQILNVFNAYTAVMTGVTAGAVFHTLRAGGGSVGASAGKALATGAIMGLIGYLSNRAQLGLFNSLPGAVAAALAVPIPSTDAEVPAYKAKVADVMNYSTWKDLKSAKAETDASHHSGVELSEHDVQGIVESVRSLGNTSARLHDALHGLDAFAKQPAAQTPAGQHCVHYTSELIFRAIANTAPPKEGLKALAHAGGAHR